MPERHETDTPKGGGNTTPTEHPLDLAIEKLRLLLSGLEARQAKDMELPEVPDDIPRFITRDWR